MEASKFLANLRAEVETHVGVCHPFLARVAQVPFTREDYRIFGEQHFALVGKFTLYLEYLLLNAPNSGAKIWLAKVLVDEYGEGSQGKDHATLYVEFLKSTGVQPPEHMTVSLHRDVTQFIREHIRIVTEEPFLVGLGAVGPGHEWAIPKMFPPIVKGLRRAGFKEEEISYFTLHMEQDVDHGLWLQEALRKYASIDENCFQIRRGALLSLEARARFWSGIQEKIVRWRQPTTMHFRPQDSKQQFVKIKPEITHTQFLNTLKRAPGVLEECPV